MAHIENDHDVNDESNIDKMVRARRARSVDVNKRLSPLTKAAGGVGAFGRAEIVKLCLRVVTAPDVSKVARHFVGESLLNEVYTSLPVSRKAIAGSLRTLLALDVADDFRHTDDTIVSQVEVLHKLAATVTDRDQAQALRAQAETLRDHHPTPDYLRKLRTLAAHTRQHAAAAGTHREVQAALDAAAATDAKIAELEARPGYSAGTTDTAAALYDETRRHISGLRDRLAAIAKSAGSNAPIVLSSDTVLTKVAGDRTGRLPVDQWVALAEDRRQLDVELTKVKKLPVGGGPSRMRPTADLGETPQVDALLTKAAGYSRLAETVTDRDAAAAYRAMAAQAEEQARNNRRNR